MDTISVYEVINNEQGFGLSPMQGDLLFERIKPYIMKNEPVEISFKDIKIMTTDFIQRGISNFYDNRTTDFIQRGISNFYDNSKFDKDIVDRCLIYKDIDEYYLDKINLMNIHSIDWYQKRNCQTVNCCIKS